MNRFFLLAATAAALLGQSIPGSYLVEFDGEPAAVLAKTRKVALAQPSDEVSARRTEKIGRAHV